MLEDGLSKVWCGSFRIHICGIKFFNCAIRLVSGIATKSAVPSLKVIHHILVRDRQPELFSSKIFSLN